MKLELVDFVRKVIGPIYPLGESRVDEIRFRNLEELLDLIDELYMDVVGIAEYDSAHEHSVKKAVTLARNWLYEKREEL